MPPTASGPGGTPSGALSRPCSAAPCCGAGTWSAQLRLTRGHSRPAGPPGGTAMSTRADNSGLPRASPSWPSADSRTNGGRPVPGGAGLLSFRRGAHGLRVDASCGASRRSRHGPERAFRPSRLPQFHCTPGRPGKLMRRSPESLGCGQRAVDQRHRCSDGPRCGTEGVPRLSSGGSPAVIAETVRGETVRGSGCGCPRFLGFTYGAACRWRGPLPLTPSEVEAFSRG